MLSVPRFGKVKASEGEGLYSQWYYCEACRKMGKFVKDVTIVASSMILNAMDNLRR